MYRKDFEILRCPICNSKIRFEYVHESYYCNNELCSKSHQNFPIVNGKPVLIDFEKSIINYDIFKKYEGRSVVVRRKKEILVKMKSFFQGESVITKKNIELIIKMLSNINDPKILIIGGGEIGAGFDAFYKRYSNNILSFDIYESDYVDFIADGHHIPVGSDYFDLVICQAVLEHVINPNGVALEINRVTKIGGLIYIETPFMQQVHEGPYDFTRFSESGHRLLFRNFKVIKSGYTAGAGTALIWSLSYFFSGIFRTRLAGRIARIFFFWLRFFDSIIPSNYNIDAACGVYFFGKKSSFPISNHSIINYYQGVQIQK